MRFFVKIRQFCGFTVHFVYNFWHTLIGRLRIIPRKRAKLSFPEKCALLTPSLEFYGLRYLFLFM